MSDPIRLLLVEDNPGDAVLLRETLRDVGGSDQFALTHVTRLDEAMAAATSAKHGTKTCRVCSDPGRFRCTPLQRLAAARS